MGGWQKPVGELQLFSFSKVMEARASIMKSSPNMALLWGITHSSEAGPSQGEGLAKSRAQAPIQCAPSSAIHLLDIVNIM